MRRWVDERTGALLFLSRAIARVLFFFVHASNVLVGRSVLDIYTSVWTIGSMHMSSHDGVDASRGEIIFGDAWTLLSNQILSNHARATRTHEVLDQIVHALVVVPKPSTGIRIRRLLGIQIGCTFRCESSRCTHLETGDVAIVSRREERWGRLERRVYINVSTQGRSSTGGRGTSLQVGTSSSSPSTTIANARSPFATRRRSRSALSRSRSCPSTVLRFLVRRVVDGCLAWRVWVWVWDLNGRGRWRRESCSARVCVCGSAIEGVLGAFFLVVPLGGLCKCCCC